MPCYRLCQVKMLKKHGPGILTRWWRNRSFFCTWKDGHDEAEDPYEEVLHKDSTYFMAEDIYEVYLLGGETAVGCGSSWNGCHMSGIWSGYGSGYQCTSSLTTKLGPTMGVHFDLRLWAAWTLSWQLFWQIRIIQAESLTSSRLTFEGCNCWKQDDPRSSFDATFNGSTTPNDGWPRPRWSCGILTDMTFCLLTAVPS